jgi:hypothetical protein
VGTPELESLSLFLSEPHLHSLPTQYSLQVDPVWVYHKYESYNTDTSRSTNDDDATDKWDNIWEGFEPNNARVATGPVDAADYAWRAQVGLLIGRLPQV